MDVQSLLIEQQRPYVYVVFRRRAAGGATGVPRHG